MFVLMFDLVCIALIDWLYERWLYVVLIIKLIGWLVSWLSDSLIDWSEKLSKTFLFYDVSDFLNLLTCLALLRAGLVCFIAMLGLLDCWACLACSAASAGLDGLPCLLGLAWLAWPAWLGLAWLGGPLPRSRSKIKNKNQMFKKNKNQKFKDWNTCKNW